MKNKQYAYCVILFDGRGKHKVLSGLFLNQEDALDAIKSKYSYVVHENYYEYLCIEKYTLNTLGYPCLVKKEDRQPIKWFRWKNESYSEIDEIPEWARHTFGFL